ncbi:DUF6493 family protein [Pleionea sp. CnH1-48]|uniref:DUF6493 family protein n=1 Tax=Pleionea sp. CnH1-48 TaxID=2954494 RepID=UPI00209728FA|nr:DUF6493 family protein [Pleionea sp. CnH1-48]MCO7223472.1 DUF6493 family protein [Pleionea sp. CnH1-48]
MESNRMQDLLPLIEAGDQQACFDFLTPLSVKHLLLVSELKSLVESLHRERLQLAEVRRKDSTLAPLKVRFQLAKACLFIVSNLSQQKTRPLWMIPEAQMLSCVVKQFQPSWINEWAEWVLDKNPRYYAIIDDWVQMGYCQKPQCDSYYLGMIDHLGDEHLVERLLSLPDVLAEDIWRIFEIEGYGEFSLASHDKYCPVSARWLNALVSLSAQGALPRERLLSCTLKALRKDYSPFRAGWYGRLLQQLNPTETELIRHLPELICLANSQVSTSVALAVRYFLPMVKSGHLSTEKLVEPLKSALNAHTKTVFSGVLRVLKAAAKVSPENNSLLLEVAVKALSLEASDIQTTALDFIESYEEGHSSEIKMLLSSYQPLLMPSIQQRVSQWIEVDSSKDIEPTFIFEQDLNAVNRIKRIQDFDELLTSISYLFELSDDVIELERTLDGLGRLATNKPEGFEFMTAALRKRAYRLVRQKVADPVRFFFALMLLSYFDNKNYFGSELDRKDLYQQPHASFIDVFYQRLCGLTQQLLDEQKLPSLSLPELPSGAVHLDTLVERWLSVMESEANFLEVEQRLAIYRIESFEKLSDKQIKQLQRRGDEFSNILLFLGGMDVQLNKEGPLFAAASEQKLKAESNDILVGLAPSMLSQENTEASLSFAQLFASANTGSYGHHVCGLHKSIVRWAATVWPANMELYYAAAAAIVDVERTEIQRQTPHYYEPLFDSNVKLGPMAMRLLAKGLSAADFEHKGMAIEVVIRALAEDRLDVSMLAEAMSKLLKDIPIKLLRWRKNLTEIATTSAYHAAQVLTLLKQLLSEQGTCLPKGIGELLELMYELKIASGDFDLEPQLETLLKGLQRGGKERNYSQKILTLH